MPIRRVQPRRGARQGPRPARLRCSLEPFCLWLWRWGQETLGSAVHCFPLFAVFLPFVCDPSLLVWNLARGCVCGSQWSGGLCDIDRLGFLGLGFAIPFVVPGRSGLFEDMLLLLVVLVRVYVPSLVLRGGLAVDV